MILWHKQDFFITRLQMSYSSVWTESSCHTVDVNQVQRHHKLVRNIGSCLDFWTLKDSEHKVILHLIPDPETSCVNSSPSLIQLSFRLGLILWWAGF